MLPAPQRFCGFKTNTMNYEFKGTLGQWAVDVNFDDEPAVVLRESGWQIGKTFIVEEISQGNEADAHLIAAAPTLLTTCIEVLKCLENAPDRPYEKNMLKVAIHQALNISPDLLGEHVTEPTEDQRDEARINTERL